MNRLTRAAAVCCVLMLVGVGWCQGPALSGSATAAVGETVWIEVDGEPAFDTMKPVNENLDAFRAWLATTRFQASSPDGSKPVLEPDVQIKFAFTQAALVWDMRARFVADRPGVYVIAAQLGQNVSLHRVEVGGQAPPPPPTPDNPNVPTPATKGPAFVVVLAVHQDLTTDQAGSLIKLRAWADSKPTVVQLLLVSPGAASSDARIVAYLKLVPKDGQLPWVIVSRARTDQAGAAVLWSGALPNDVGELITRVEGAVK